MTELARLVRHQGGVPAYRYPSHPDAPPVALVRVGHEELSDREHIHNFPALWYEPAAGLVYVIGAGEVIDPAHVRGTESGVGVFFDPAALGGDGHSPWPTWRAHRLLFLFLHGQPGGVLRLEVPAARRQAWDTAIESMEAELVAHKQGYREAVLAHLTLLLIDLARLADEAVGDLRSSGEPLLAEVFAVIDDRYSQALSLRDVAGEVGVTAGHLTTVVRRRTGRTVQEWITERRMTEARRLLADTHLAIGEIARRVGLPDPGYFTRVFRRTHGISPRAWRARPAASP
ncbi:HTH-type transcriptional activator Btr [Mycobacterium talmoniae]|uniref:HTH-type transcriptional activator Btr n=1 Tax=Mycobacterium talmoniae TaxID=1858794 RepID=A0A2S8BEE9_9MYCO|nr:helix-turn-helix transcriptional regulator [Mycobacterium eburneum]PQM45057.1 HTH-type transcriptional activator Btr [Mycobacterium talmoniae]TDH52664.1 AraC family transcriptional regulator [Mycobacterium eburneum]